MSHLSELAQLQLIVSLASAGKFDEAAQRVTEIASRDIAAEGWLVIARANANKQRWVPAQSALENASRLVPGTRAIRLEQAMLAQQRGEDVLALGMLRTLAAESVDSPGLLGHLARALSFAGLELEAERHLSEGLRRWPTEPGLHKQLAELRWRQGRESATTELERAIAAYPDVLPLRLVAADQLRAAGSSERALSFLEDGLARTPDSPGLLTSSGVLLDDLGRDDEALARLRHAARLAPSSAVVRRNLVPALLRAQAIEEALWLLAGLLEEFPDDQLLIAWRATALRLRGDAEYESLHDYRRLVRVHDLPPPAGFADIAAFMRTLAQELSALHRSEQRPLVQSLRGGSQTERNLPTDPGRHPAIAAFFALLDAPIRQYIDDLDAGRAHPTDRRRTENYRFTGSWSVLLKPGGFHISHVHPQGWISSACYVELPDAATRAERSGWLRFGEPGMTRPVCEADHYVEPRVGRLVLFPSHFWHGTVPFESGGRRLTAAFDVLPD